MSATDQFTEDTTLTAVAIAYRNPDQALIADDVLPRVTAPSRSFKWTSYNGADAFTLPETRVGRRGTPNRVEIEGEEKTASVEDFGIDVPLDNPTIEEAERNGHDPRGRATERATDIVMLDREVRVAGMIQDTSNYHGDHVEALSGGDVFNDPSSDPVKILEEMINNCWMRPNQLVFGHDAWMALRRHPRIAKMINRTSGDEARATRAQIAEILEVQRVLVGAGRVNINKPGVNPTVERVWGNVVAGQYINRTADTTGGVTFGFTAQHGTKVGGTLPANMGIRGGILVRSAETLVEKIVANRAGFLLQGVIAG